METLDLQDQRDFLDSLDLQDQKETVAAKAAMASRGREDFLDPLETPAREVQEESVGKLDLRDPSASLEHQEAEACQVLLVPWVLRASQATEDFRESKVPRANLEIWEGQELQVSRDSGDLLGDVVQGEPLDQWASRATTGRTGRLGSPGCREWPGGRDPWAHPGTRASLVTRVPRAPPEFQDLRAPVVTPARMDRMVALDLQGLMVHQETEEHLEVPDPEVSRACPDPRARMELQARMVSRVCRESWV